MPQNEAVVEEAQWTTLRMSHRARKLANPNNYMVYQKELDFHVVIDQDLTMYCAVFGKWKMP